MPGSRLLHLTLLVLVLPPVGQTIHTDRSIDARLQVKPWNAFY